MIFTIQTNDEVSGLDITNLLNFAHIEHTILSKQNDEAAQPLRAVDAAKVCPECDGAVEFCAMGHYVPSAPRP